jgi:hypothetical protein
MGSSGGSETTTQTMRYAPYVEDFHGRFLDTMASHREVAIAVSPYSGYTADVVDEDFFGVGYLISNFASLSDMFGKFMAGFDVETLWGKAVTAILTPSEIQEHITEQKETLDTQVIMKDLPDFQRDMRDKNAVVSSSFIVGKGMIEDKRVKDLADIYLNATTQLLPTVEKQWIDGMNWNKGVVTSYALVMREYFADRMTTDESRNKLVVADRMWPFTVLNFERRGLQAIVPKTAQAKKLYASFLNSPAMKVVSIIAWTAQGAYIGSTWGPYGTLIGGVIGFVVGLALTFIE